ncbi:hypothetical protein EXIGUO8H_20723 [Exiguobacterium sp. 8H]|nr:hypothetical protein EXIGUO8H_20723 [Exiguobacterium sp. 8H]
MLCPSFHRDVSPFQKQVVASKVMVWLNNGGPEGKLEYVSGDEI